MIHNSFGFYLFVPYLTSLFFLGGGGGGGAHFSSTLFDWMVLILWTIFFPCTSVEVVYDL